MAVPTLLVAAWGIWLLAPAAILTLTSFWWTRRSHLDARSPRFVRTLRTTEDGQWLLVRRGGELRARLSGDSVVLPGLCVLVFRIGRFARRVVFVDNQSTSADSFRRLRMTLKSGARPTSDWT